MTKIFFDDIFLKDFLPIIQKKLFDNIDTSKCWKEITEDNVNAYHDNIIKLLDDHDNIIEIIDDYEIGSHEHFLNVLQDKYLLLLFKFNLKYKNNNSN